MFDALDFLNFSIWDFIDIILVGILFFQVYKLLRGSLAITIFTGLLVVYLVTKVVNALEMNMLSTILGTFVGQGFILLAIVFQQEIRRFLFYIGKGSGIGKIKFWQRLFTQSNVTKRTQLHHAKEDIIRAINNMASTKTGCLIVFTDPSEKRFFADTGVPINGDISSKLLESIFDKTSPLHDGAIAISELKILSAGCVLPVSENPELPTRIGMRHRAAVGVTEQIDAHVLIVSEERGKISHAHKGKIKMNLTQKNLSDILASALSL